MASNLTVLDHGLDVCSTYFLLRDKKCLVEESFSFLLPVKGSGIEFVESERV